MPPKKTKTTDATVKKSGRIRKLLRSPCSSDCCNDGNSSEKSLTMPFHTIQKLTEMEQHTIALANEVSQMQFPQKYCFENDIRNEKPINKKPVLKRKIGQNKKKVINNELSVAQESDNTKDLNNLDAGEPVNKKKKYVRKIVKSPKQSTSEKRKAPKKKVSTKKPSKKKEDLKAKKATKTTDTKPVALKKNLSFNYKSKFADLKLTRTVVNDYVSDQTSEIELNLEHTINGAKDRQMHEISKDSFLNTSEFSWANEVSSLSSTCYSRNELVAIDNKIPVLKLTKIDHVLGKGVFKNCVIIQEEKPMTASGSTSETSYNIEHDFDISSNSLELSTSTESSQISSVKEKTPLEKLAFLDTFDLDILNWTLYDTEVVDTGKFEELLEKEDFFQEERNVLANRTIFELLGENWVENKDIEVDIKQDCNSVQSTVKLGMAKPEEKCMNDQLNIHNEPESHKSPENNNNLLEYEKNIDNENEYTHLDDDDDDALSLFAESITGIESSQRSCQNPPEPELEEYVPQPITEVFKVPKPVSYNPSKIQKDLMKSLNQICTKQKADSTSLQNDFQNSEDSSESTKHLATDDFSSKNPGLMSLLFKPIEFVKSVVFKGVCMFYLKGACKKNICMFPHTIPDAKTISTRLTHLSYDEFVQEYMMLRTQSNFRQLYGMCYVNEAIRRKLSRILVEMAIDFIKMSTKQEGNLKTEVLEQTLLYLNYVDLNSCSDLLRFQLKPGELLCDHLLQVIGQSQNFSRFRTIFINLTTFMCRGNRTFNSDIVCQILERVCILPYELGLARALLQILKRTDPSVLRNPMCERFQKKLSTDNKEFSEELNRIKHMALGDMQPSTSRVPVSAEKDIRYSPDTTNYDNYQHISRRNKLLKPPLLSTPGPSGMKQKYWTNELNKFRRPHKAPSSNSSGEGPSNSMPKYRGSPRWHSPRPYKKVHKPLLPHLNLNSLNFPRRPGPGYF